MWHTVLIKAYPNPHRITMWVRTLPKPCSHSPGDRESDFLSFAVHPVSLGPLAGLLTVFRVALQRFHSNHFPKLAWVANFLVSGLPICSCYFLTGRLLTEFVELLLELTNRGDYGMLGSGPKTTGIISTHNSIQD